MRLLGIDYGTKRVGVALTDESGAMAFPHDTFLNDAMLRERLEALAEEKGVSMIVIGLSHTLGGTPNLVQKEIDALAEYLRESLKIPVHLEPEQFTTQAALRLQGRTEKTDASAAALILDGYLIRNQQKHD
jgi:putative Holliday junction resolvase